MYKLCALGYFMQICQSHLRTFYVFLSFVEYYFWPIAIQSLDLHDIPMQKLSVSIITLGHLVRILLLGEGACRDDEVGTVPLVVQFPGIERG